MTEEAERIIFCVCSAGCCMVAGERSAPCVSGINTAWDNFFFCMTAGNENRGIQPLVFKKPCRYQSTYHTSLCFLTAEENAECSSVKERSLCLKWKTYAHVERYLDKK